MVKGIFKILFLSVFLSSSLFAKAGDSVEASAPTEDARVFLERTIGVQITESRDDRIPGGIQFRSTFTNEYLIIPRSEVEEAFALAIEGLEDGHPDALEQISEPKPTASVTYAIKLQRLFRDSLIAKMTAPHEFFPEREKIGNRLKDLADFKRLFGMLFAIGVLGTTYSFVKNGSNDLGALLAITGGMLGAKWTAQILIRNLKAKVESWIRPGYPRHCLQVARGVVFPTP